jgi:inorganic pyrophosphatase
VLEIMQTEKGKKERNDRIFVVPDRSPFEADLTDIRRLPRRAMKNWSDSSKRPMLWKTSSLNFSDGKAHQKRSKR